MKHMEHSTVLRHMQVLHMQVSVSLKKSSKRSMTGRAQPAEAIMQKCMVRHAQLHEQTVMVVFSGDGSTFGCPLGWWLT